MNIKLSSLFLFIVLFSLIPLSVQSQSTCIDNDGDGWGWNGKESCRVQSQAKTSSSSDCVDTDGDGWGWDGEKSCTAQPVTSLPASNSSTCEDPDGDGYGWNGSETCVVNEVRKAREVSSGNVRTSSLGSRENPLPADTHPRCFDRNGDGNETIVFRHDSTHYSCDSSNKQSCTDLDGDGKGTLHYGRYHYHCNLGTREFPLPEATHPRCIDWNGDGKTTIQPSLPDLTHFRCDPSQFKCIDSDGDGEGLLNVNYKLYKCFTSPDERLLKLPTAAELNNENLIASCKSDVVINSTDKYFNQYAENGDYLWKCAKRCSQFTPSDITTWEREKNSTANFCINGGKNQKVDDIIEVLYRPGKKPSYSVFKTRQAKSVTPVATVTAASQEVNNQINSRVADLVAQADRGEAIDYDTRYEVVGIASAHHEEVVNDPNSTAFERTSSRVAVAETMRAMDGVYKRSGDYVASELMGLDEEQADLQANILAAIGGRVNSKSGGRVSHGAVIKATFSFFQEVATKLSAIATGSSGGGGRTTTQGNSRDDDDDSSNNYATGADNIVDEQTNLGDSYPGG